MAFDYDAYMQDAQAGVTPAFDVDAYMAESSQATPSTTEATPQPFDFDAYMADAESPQKSPDMVAFEKRNTPSDLSQQARPAGNVVQSGPQDLTPSPAIKPVSGPLPVAPLASPEAAGLKEAGQQTLNAAGSVAAGVTSMGRGVLGLVNKQNVMAEKAANAMRRAFGFKEQPKVYAEMGKELDQPTKLEMWSAEQTEKTAQEMAKSGGVGLETAYRIAQGAGEAFASTAITLGMAGGAGAGGVAAKGMVEGMKAALPQAAKFAGMVYATTPGPQAERIKAAGHATALIMGGSVAGWLPSALLRKATAFVINAGMNTPAYAEAYLKAQQLAQERGGKTSDYLASTMTPQLLLDGLFSVVTPNMRRQQAELRREVVSEAKKPSTMPQERPAEVPVTSQGEASHKAPEETVEPPVESGVPGVVFRTPIDGVEKPISGTPTTEITQGAAGGTQAPAQDKAAPTSLGREATSLRNSQTDQERVAMGLKPRFAIARQTNQEQWDMAMDRLASNPDAAKQLVSQLETKMHTPSPVENSLLLHEKIMRDTEFHRANKEMIDAFTSGDTARIESATIRMAEAKKASQTIFDLVGTGGTGTEQGRALQSRNMFVDPDEFTVVSMERRVMAEQGGKPLSPEQSEAIQRQASDIAELQKAFDEHVAQKQAELDRQATELKTAQARNNFEEIVNDVLKGGVKPRTFGDKFVAKVRANAEASRARMKERAGRASVGVDPMVLVDMVNIGLEYIVDGTIYVKGAWRKKMLADLGPESEPYLDEVLKQAMLKVKDVDKAELAAQINKKKATKGTEVADVSGDMDISKSVKQLVRDEVEAGVRDLDGAINNVHRLVKEVLPDITVAEVRDAFSDYGKTRMPKQDEVSVVLRDLRAQSQKVSQLQAALRGEAPKKTGTQGDQPSQKVRELTKQVHNAMKEMGVEITSPEQQLQTSLASIKTRLENQIADLTKAITNREKLSTNKIAVKYDADAEAKKKQRDALKAIYDDMFPQGPITPEQRIIRATKAAQRTLEIWDARVKEAQKGRFKAAAEGKSSSWSEELGRLKQQTKDMREQVKTLQDLANPKLSPELQAIESYKKRVDKRIKELEARGKAGDFEPKKRQELDISKDPEALRKRAELNIAKQRFADLAEKAAWDNMNPWAKAGARGVAYYDSARNLMTSGELSFVLRQGKMAALSHPIMAIKALAPMFKTLLATQAKAQALDAEVHTDPLAENARRAKLHIVEENATLSKQEEINMGRYQNAIPVLRNFNWAARVFLNKVRMDMFKAMRKSLSKTGEPTPEEEKQIAMFINESTGRGGLGGPAGEKAGVVLSRIFFSPRYFTSRIGLLSMHGVWGGPKEARRAKMLVAKEYGRMAIGLGLYYTLLYSFFNRDDKAKIGKTTTSSDLGKIRKGDTTLDPLAGLSQSIVLAERMRQGVTTNSKGEIVPIRETATTKVPYGKDDAVGVAGRFVKSKLHPAITTALNFASGRDFNRKLVTVPSTINSLAIPITYGDVFQVFKSQGFTDAAAMSMLAVLGEGLQTYQRDEEGQDLPERWQK